MSPACRNVRIVVALGNCPCVSYSHKYLPIFVFIVAIVIKLILRDTAREFGY